MEAAAWLIGWCVVSFGMVAVWCAAIVLAPVVAGLWALVRRLGGNADL